MAGWGERPHPRQQTQQVANQHEHEDRKDQRRITTTRSEEHTSELQTLMRNSYAVFCLKKKSWIKQRDLHYDDLTLIRAYMMVHRDTLHRRNPHNRSINK